MSAWEGAQGLPPLHKMREEATKSTSQLDLLVVEIFSPTTKHLFVMDEAELGCNEAMGYLAWEDVAAEVEVHCTTEVELFPLCLAASHHHNSVRRTETAALILYMSILCSLGPPFKGRLAFKEDNEG